MSHLGRLQRLFFLRLIPLLVCTALQISSSWAQKSPKPTEEALRKKATQALARLQWALLKENVQELKRLTADNALMNNQLLSKKPNLEKALEPCLLWYELKQSQKATYEGEVLKRFAGTSESALAQQLLPIAVWIKADAPKSLASMFQTDRLFFYDVERGQFIKFICSPVDWRQNNALPLKVIQNEGSQESETSEWLRSRRAWTFYYSIMPALYTRMWTAFFVGQTKDALNAWAPIAKVTALWLKRAAQSSSPKHAVDRDLQRAAQTLLPKLARLNPELAASELTFLQSFYIDEIFPLASEIFAFSAWMGQWHYKSSPPSPATAEKEYKLFMKDEEADLRACCFDDKGFKALSTFHWPTTATPPNGTMIPPPPPPP